MTNSNKGRPCGARRWSSRKTWSGKLHVATPSLRVLENDLSAVLHNASWIEAIEAAEGSIIDVIVWNSLLRMVPEVEELNANLSSDVLSDISILEQRHIRIPNCRTVERIPSEIAVANYSTCWIGR